MSIVTSCSSISGRVTRASPDAVWCCHTASTAWPESTCSAVLSHGC